MNSLITIITSTEPEVKNRSLDEVCKMLTAEELLQESLALEQYRRSEPNLYNRVRALFFLYAIHRFYIPFQKNIDTRAIRNNFV